MEYRVKTQQFEGPLDLLLHLIEKAELNIEDIFISEITAQFLAAVGELDSGDMDRASEFISVAAQLLLIKSRRLLPRPLPPTEEGEDPEQAFIQRLIDYKRFKELGESFEKLYEQASHSVTRLPEELPPPGVDIEDIAPDALLDAFMGIFNKTAAKDVPKDRRVRQDSFTVRGCAARLRALLRERKRLVFTELFTPDTSRMELVVTFMALLEMLRHGEIRITQGATFAPIRIRAATLTDGVYDYMDEEGEV